MNKKFINVLLLLAVTGAGCSTFTSCKDTDDDLRVEWSQADANLQKKVEQLSQELSALKSSCDACRTECQQKIADLLLKLAEANGKIQGNADEIARLKAQIQQISNQITNEILVELNKKVDADQVKNIFESYTIEYFKNLGLLTADDIKDFITKADIADELAQIASLTQSVSSLQTNYNNLSSLVNTINNKYDQLVQDIKDGKIGLTEEDVNRLIDAAIATAKQELQTAITNINASIATINTEITNLKAADNANKALIDALTRRVSTLETQVAEISQIKTRLDNIETRLSTTEQKAIEAYNQAMANDSRLTVLEGLVDGFKTQLATINANIGDMTGLTNLADEIRDLKNKNTELENKINSLDSKLVDEIGKLDSKIDAVNTALGQRIDALEDRVEANEDAIRNLQLQVDKLLGLENRINSLITSVLVQGTYNPLFGTFSLPIGVQSNMLVGYYGMSEKQTYDFPSTQNFATFDNKPQVTADELRMLEASGCEPVKIENGQILMNKEDGNLGKIFVTINPNNINFEGQNLPLVNSLDQSSKVELRNLRPSQELLTFGYTKGGGNNNGFYEADATLPANMEAISATAVHIHENLKSSMKQILEDKRTNLRSNLMHLMKAVYDQFNGILPAYAMKAAWEVNGENFAVYSNYNIAATTFKPLSYGFLYGHGYGDVIPTIDPISEAILNLNPDDYKFDFSDIKVNVNTSDATLDISIDDIVLNYDGSLTVTVTGKVYDENGKEIGTSTLTGQVQQGDMDEFLKAIQDQFNDKIGDWNDSIQKAYKKSIEKLMAEVDKAVEEMLGKMQGQINDKIADMITSIQDEVNGKFGSYIGKFNDFIERYNSLAQRINNVFNNPNHYLQPTMLYKAGNGGVHFLSGNASKPTIFHKAGGNGIMLYATSYTGEIIAPAYQKMVACVNVIDNATKQTAQANGGELLNELKAINSAQYLAEVRHGDQRRFALPTASMKVGHTYEILYTAVDYLGVTSTARFYLTVVD